MAWLPRADHNQKNPFSGRISAKLSLCFSVLLLLFLAVGAISLLLARSISEIPSEVASETRHIEVTEDIHSTIQRLIHGIDRVASSSPDGIDSIKTLEKRLLDALEGFYLEHISEKEPFPEKHQEINLIERLRSETAALSATRERILAAIEDGEEPDPTDLAALDGISNNAPSLTQQLNSVHWSKVRRLNERNRWTMSLLVKVYLACFLIGTALVGVSSAILFRKISSPLRRLAAATISVSQGDLSKRMDLESNDEIGQLSQSFNTMAATLEEHERELNGLNAMLERKVKETQALYRIGTEISSSLELNQILHSVVEKAKELLQADCAALCMFDDGIREAGLKVTSGPALAFVCKTISTEPGPAEDQSTCLSSETCVPGNAPESKLTCKFFNSTYVRSHLAAPLKKRDKTLGALCVGRCENREYREVRNLAAVEERERIAREMHDGLAQALGLIYLRIDRLQELGTGAAPRLEHELEGVKKIAENAYDEVRQSIFGLRTQVSRGRKLLPVLTEYLHEFSTQTNINVSLVADDDRAVQFSPAVEVQLIRIIQEALTNVRKHAMATRAVVNFCRNGDRARVTVEDNGRGFKMSEVSSNGGNHFGLHTMRERAQSIGGSLEVKSSHERGTMITVEFPIPSIEEYQG
ncbi:MAG: HAMP domain-containing protein [Candidatus Tectomicrobia bacterium]|uniref:histidine kinase n=1 Tax=Tectimicrobiota bacterium TaxID=2528274 RepID=A0A932GN24_UNCTE|nr:HAMP domain-containing protein [Candidatus Tectomicrobia bacterium]